MHNSKVGDWGINHSWFSLLHVAAAITVFTFTIVFIPCRRGIASGRTTSLGVLAGLYYVSLLYLFSWLMQGVTGMPIRTTLVVVVPSQATLKTFWLVKFFSVLQDSRRISGVVTWGFRLPNALQAAGIIGRVSHSVLHESLPTVVQKISNNYLISSYHRLDLL
jgi:hypothetical protein